MSIFNKAQPEHYVLAQQATFRCSTYSDTWEYKGDLISVTWLDSNKRELLRYTPEFGFSTSCSGRLWGSFDGYTVMKSDSGFPLSIDKELIKY